MRSSREQFGRVRDRFRFEAARIARLPSQLSNTIHPANSPGAFFCPSRHRSSGRPKPADGYAVQVGGKGNDFRAGVKHPTREQALDAESQPAQSHRANEEGANSTLPRPCLLRHQIKRRSQGNLSGDTGTVRRTKGSHRTAGPLAASPTPDGLENERSRAERARSGLLGARGWAWTLCGGYTGMAISYRSA